MSDVSKFTIIPANNFIWNKSELLSFLIDNQGKSIVLSTKEEGCCCNSIGLYNILDKFKFKSVTIITNNLVETHPEYTINYINPFKFFNTTTQYEEFHLWNKNKVFGALYNRALWHRIGIASHLAPMDNTLLNFRSNPHNIDDRDLFELQKLFNIDPPSLKKFMDIFDALPIQVKNIDDYTVGATTTEHTNQLCMLYPNFLIDVVAETFTSGRSFFPTEKTVRPMLLKKPFIIMGSKCFLIHLRQMGFKTFYDFWDEDYDGYQPHDRYKMILNLINDLAKKSKEELYKMYLDMTPILEHNFNLLKNKSFTKAINYVE